MRAECMSNGRHDARSVRRWQATAHRCASLGSRFFAQNATDGILRPPDSDRTANDIVSAVNVVEAALQQPLMQRARSAAIWGQCHREVSVALRPARRVCGRGCSRFGLLRRGRMDGGGLQDRSRAAAGIGGVSAASRAVCVGNRRRHRAERVGGLTPRASATKNDRAFDQHGLTSPSQRRLSSGGFKKARRREALRYAPSSAVVDGAILM